LKEIIYTCT